jgi:hypothetical protein
MNTMKLRLEDRALRGDVSASDQNTEYMLVLRNLGIRHGKINNLEVFQQVETVGRQGYELCRKALNQ